MRSTLRTYRTKGDCCKLGGTKSANHCGRHGLQAKRCKKRKRREGNDGCHHASLILVRVQAEMKFTRSTERAAGAEFQPCPITGEHVFSMAVQSARWRNGCRPSMFSTCVTTISRELQAEAKVAFDWLEPVVTCGRNMCDFRITGQPLAMT